MKKTMKYEKLMRIGTLFLSSLAMFICIILFFTIEVKASNNITIAGIDMGYSDGSYFSKNGSACTCHGRGTCGEATDCNCIVVSGTCQCYGWSMWVENKLFGYNEISNSQNFTTVISGYSNCTGSETYNKFYGKVGVGAHIRTSSSKKGYAHSVSVISYDQNGINITDCNHSGKCQVDVRYYSWDSFASFMNGYGGISFVKTCKNGDLNLPNPSIVGTYWGNISDSTFRPVIVINNPETVKEVKFAVWSTGNQSDLKWYNANYNGVGGYFKDINFDDFGNKIYICHVYVYGYNGSVQSIEMERLDTYDYSKPNIRGVYWGNATETTFRPVIEIENPTSVKNVQFAVWTTGDQSDLKWYDANHNGEGGYFKDICYSDLKYQKYFCHAYVYGNDGSTTSIALNSFDTYNAEGLLEGVEGGIGSITIGGWAFDRSNIKECIYVHSYAVDSMGNYTFLGETLADQGRADVNNVFSVGDYHGFSDRIITSLSGTYTITVSAINIGGGNEVTFLGSKTVTITQPTIYFDSCGGKECTPCNVINMEKYGPLPDTIRSGYTFDGWYTEKESGQKITEDEIVMLTDNQTLFAHWIKDCTHINTEVRDVRAATCTEEGYTGDTYCKDCDTKLVSGEVTFKISHSWNEGEITKTATCTEKGLKTYTCMGCETTKIEDLPATGHLHTELRNGKVATCSEAGYTGDTYCKDCDTKLSTGNVISKKAHTWNEGEITKAATCSEKGVRTYTCTGCEITKTEDIAATGHQHTELRNVRAATCAEEGYTGDIYCKDCETKLSLGEAIAKRAHIWDDGVVTKVATCIEKGVKTYTCISCETTKTEDIAIIAIAHQHTELRNVRAATCAEEGYTGDTYCTDCETKLSSGQTISKKTHIWDEGVVTKAATCTEEGVKTYTCTGCETTKTEDLSATGHQHTELRNVKTATCTEEGYTGDTYCRDCETKLSLGKPISKKAHTWDEGAVTKAATCTEKGVKTFSCTSCEITKTEDIPATGHENKVTKFAKEASCKSDGYTGDIYCQDCGKLLEEGKLISKTDHIWNSGEVTKSATCTDEGIKTLTCTSCGTTKTEIVSATGHGTTEVRNKKNANCVTDGYTGDAYCTICNQKISSGVVVAKTGHSWDGGKVTKQPTTTETGIRTYTCRNCGTTKIETISKLKPQTATPGKIINDKSTNGIYKVQKDGLSVEFTKPVSKKASVKIPDTVKVDGITCKVTGISTNAFKNNTSLKTVSIGKNVTVIGANAFYGCKKLGKVSGGNSIVKIGDKAFANCVRLSSVTIAGTVKSIGKQAFYNCKKLRTITIKTSALSSKTIGAKAFTGTYSKPTVRVPVKNLNAYKKLLKSKGMSGKAVYKK